ncbi:hypothetical protein GCM10022278_29670 [Allohahella marinimesophila]|uniref:Uncharacterized protein n=1 Tax=Allohahella marinimesophila TaxID=1054972 RepID=A0ABP7PS14_9GAMM
MNIHGGPQQRYSWVLATLILIVLFIGHTRASGSEGFDGAGPTPLTESRSGVPEQRDRLPGVQR